jgi:arsenite methyltransferase
MEPLSPSQIHLEVQEHYGKFARETGGCCSSANPADGTFPSLYPEELTSTLPSDVTNFSAGSGDPISLAKLNPGETVLDLGSVGGLDCFLAAQQVGRSGHVIGVDMTPKMLARARSSASRLNTQNVEFREGFLESLPVDSSSVDVIISNCVVNLSPDKRQVFKEMMRVLKPGGRIAISDMVSNRAIQEAVRKNIENWCACSSGALPALEYSHTLEESGFTEIQIEPNIETILRAVDSGYVQRIDGQSKEQLKEQLLIDLRNPEKVKKTMVAPHNIIARKPF